MSRAMLPLTVEGSGPHFPRRSESGFYSARPAAESKAVKEETKHRRDAGEQVRTYDHETNTPQRAAQVAPKEALRQG